MVDKKSTKVNPLLGCTLIVNMNFPKNLLQEIAIRFRISKNFTVDLNEI